MKNSQVPKLPREGTIARAIVDGLISGRPGEEHSWSQLKKMYERLSPTAHKNYTGMTLSRILRKWTTRVGRGRYTSNWLECACVGHLIPNPGGKFVDVDMVAHTWDNCSAQSPWNSDYVATLVRGDDTFGPESFGGEDYPSVDLDVQDAVDVEFEIIDEIEEVEKRIDDLRALKNETSHLIQTAHQTYANILRKLNIAIEQLDELLAAM
jgi:hypothetical protein